MTRPPPNRVLLGFADIELRIRQAVAARRANDPDPDDPVRGLYISEEQVDRLLDSESVRSPPRQRLERLASAFRLDEYDLECLLVAAAPDLDVRFERLYGYLHDDITRRRASIGLVLELLGLSPLVADDRGRFSISGRLVGPGLLDIDDADRPFLTRSLRVPDRVTEHLLGGETPTPTVAAVEVDVPAVAPEGSSRAARAIAGGVPVVYLREASRTAGLAAGVAALQTLGRTSLAADLTRLDPQSDSQDVITELARDAGLRGAGLVAGPVDDLLERDQRALGPLRHAACPVVLVGRRAWNSAWLNEAPAMIELAPPSRQVRSAMWAQIAGPDTDFDPAAATVQYRVTPEQAARAWEAAERQAIAAGHPVNSDDLRAGIRLQNAGGLDRLARRVTPRADFQDLVLPDRVMALLREIVERARHRDQVLDGWKMGGRALRGRGITALFAGESGTGKTLSAEVIAHELGLDLYTIDLSTVVDKYVGETEKNLDRIFEQAEDVNAVLFFDEADALFGKRSEVSDARDRYANVEVAYLLQRMESFDGITVLATNLRANLDAAFTRRIDVLVDFPEPEEDDRERLWAMHLPSTLPREGELDLGFLARSFELSGGDIRNVTLAAAYAAAANGGRVTTTDLVVATAREYRKLGRLVHRSEFGPYHDLVAAAPRTEGRSHGHS